MSKFPIAAFTLLALSLTASAGNISISFQGNLRTDATFTNCGAGCTLGPSNTDGDYAQWAAVVEAFNVAAPSTMSAVTYSYGGGTNAQNAAIAQGGFEPYLTLFDSSGNFLASTFSGTYCPAGANVYQGLCVDVLLDGGLLPAGTYQIALSAWENMSFAENNGPPALLSDGFTGLGNLAAGEDMHFAFDVFLSNNAPSVPEPATLGLIGIGLALAGLIHRRRSVWHRQ